MRSLLHRRKLEAPRETAILQIKNFANKWFGWDSESILLPGQVLGAWRLLHSSIDFRWLNFSFTCPSLEPSIL